jgi:hypothetical protein
MLDPFVVPPHSILNAVSYKELEIRRECSDQHRVNHRGPHNLIPVGVEIVELVVDWNHVSQRRVLEVGVRQRQDETRIHEDRIKYGNHNISIYLGLEVQVNIVDNSLDSLPYKHVEDRDKD